MRTWRSDNAQLDILALGEYFMVDTSEVPQIQQQMRDGSELQFAEPAGTELPIGCP
jgi:hypothetical protein